MLRAHLLDGLDATARASLDAALSPLVRLDDEPQPAVDTEVLVAGWPSSELLDALPALRALVIPFAGMPGKTRKTLEGRDLALYNLHHNAPAVAEMAVGLLLAAARGLIPMDRMLRQGDWRGRHQGDQGVTLFDQRAVVLGYGAIGARAAALCRGLGMEVTAVRRGQGASSVEDGVEVVGPQRWPGVLEGARALLVCVPDTPLTRGMVNAEALALLGPQGVLVNVGRAAVLDEEALYEALAERRLYSAGLDVWSQYPKTAAERLATFPSRHPFHQLDNVVMSPHRAGHGEASERLRGQGLAEVLGALARGEEHPWRLDLARGY